MKNAFIVSSILEYNWVLVNYNGYDILTNDYILQKKYPTLKNIYDFEYDYTLTSEEIESISHDWFLNSTNILSEFNIFQAMIESNQILITNSFREFDAIRYLSSIYDNIYCFNDTFISNTYLVKCFDKLKLRNIYFSKNDKNIYYSQRFIASPFKKWVYKFGVVAFLAFIQNLFLKKYLINCNVIFADWTNLDFAKKHKLTTTKLSLNIFNTIYLCRESLRVADYIHLFTLPSYLEFKNNISFKYPKITNKVLIYLYDLLKHNFEINKDSLIDFYLHYLYFFRVYKPISVIVPSERFDFHAILIQLAKKNRVTTYLLKDGYPWSYRNIRTLYSLTDNTSLINHVFIHGTFPAINSNSKKYLSEDDIPITSPLVNKYINVKLNKKEYDCIIMSYMFNDFNIAARPDLISKELLNLITWLHGLSIYKIAIKVKGINDYIYYSNLLNNFILDPNIVILRGYFHEVIGKSEFIIGGLSTAIAECIINKIPYYIYEPISNGYTDDDIKESFLSSLIYINRSINDLDQSFKLKLNTESIDNDIKQQLILSNYEFKFDNHKKNVFIY